MALNLVLVQQRQSAAGIALSWTPLEGASAHQVFVASRRLSPEELEAAAPRAAAYEVIASDHQIFPDELADALAGRADFTTATAVAPTVSCVIDNTTPREARGWFAVIVRQPDGRRGPHPFKVGDAASSGRRSAPFLNPNRTGDLRAEVEALLADGREQWARWKSEQDAGARREAKRMVGDALLIWPEYPAAQRLLAEIG